MSGVFQCQLEALNPVGPVPICRRGVGMGMLELVLLSCMTLNWPCKVNKLS